MQISLVHLQEVWTVWKDTFFLSENIEKTVRFLPELVTRNVSSAFSKSRI